MDDSPSFGRWLRQRRRALDLTQDELARGVGCASSTIRKIEADELRPSKQLAGLIAERLHVPAEDRAPFLQFARRKHPASSPTAGHGEPEHISFPPRSNLPNLLTSFVGREREVAQVDNLLRAARLVTLTGPGGVGKTRLAIRVASVSQDRYADGVYLVDLAPLQDPSLVLQTVAETLGLREEPSRSLLPTMIDWLQPRHLLLVLDNCEHLVDACANLAERLLAACPNLRVLATSREGLGVTGEVLFVVPPLSLLDIQQLPPPAELLRSEALSLFVQRAQAVQPDFSLTDENAAAAVRICRRLDGIPLAIELAAARVRLLTVEHIANRLDDRFHLLTTGGRTAPPRQQTLLACIDWSYELLLEEARRLLRRLSVFAGGFSLDAAQAICSDEMLPAASVLDEVSHLVDRSLVIAELEREKERYHLLESIREYAYGKLVGSGEAGPIRSQHMNFYLHMAEETEPKLQGGEQLIWLNRLEQENDNLRVALASSREEGTGDDSGLNLAAALWRFWWLRGHLNEGRECLTAMLARNVETSPARAKALVSAANMAYYQGDYDAARSLYEEGRDIYERFHDSRGAADALNGLGNIAFSKGDYASARRMYEASLHLRRELEDDWSVANSLCNLGGLAQSQGDNASASLLYEECLTMNRRLGDRRGIAFVLNNLGDVLLSQGDPGKARSLERESLALYRAIGDKWGIGYALASLGDCEVSTGDNQKANKHYKEGLKLLMAFKDRNGIARSLEGIAVVASQTNQLEKSVRLCGAAQSLLDTMGVGRPRSQLAQRDRLLAGLRAQLDEDTFESEWSQGCAMTMKEATTYALSEMD